MKRNHLLVYHSAFSMQPVLVSLTRTNVLHAGSLFWARPLMFDRSCREGCPDQLHDEAVRSFEVVIASTPTLVYSRVHIRVIARACSPPAVGHPRRQGRPLQGPAAVLSRAVRRGLG